MRLGVRGISGTLAGFFGFDVKIAAIGAGVSGLTAAALLSAAHEVTLFEAEPRLGGHAHTHALTLGGRTWPVDTGFMVFNERTYPNFIRLISDLGIESRPSDMSFSVRCRRCRLELSSRGIDGLFAQRSRLLSASHWRLLRDIFRFFALGREALARGDEARTLGAFLDDGGFGDDLARHFVLPMGGAIWSASSSDMRAFPAASYLRFMENHGLLAAGGQPTWRTIIGGSRRYVDALAARLGDGVRAGQPVVRVRREEAGVEITTADGAQERFDAVVIGTHADQALQMLADPSDGEREALGAFRYSSNDTWLHSDARFLPDEPDAQASWNCDLLDCTQPDAPVAVTYDLNRLQGHRPGQALLCSLNPLHEVEGEVHARMHYTHPILDGAAVAAQPRVAALNGQRHTWYCGAHLRYGFHEDGVMSALAVVKGLGVGV
ncbi:MAG: FAD-dependent oxidoreductase [Acidobacteria bacterium]|nr:FAD-dependent oxidoreductase [Acidobacteriota bacterium]